MFVPVLLTVVLLLSLWLGIGFGFLLVALAGTIGSLVNPFIGVLSGAVTAVVLVLLEVWLIVSTVTAWINFAHAPA